MRGTPIFSLKACRSPRNTPAYAGNTNSTLHAGKVRREHPRVCGEHKSTGTLRLNGWGTPPRMRGTHQNGRVTGVCIGNTPAYAGNTVAPAGAERLG